jgi:Protein of unknown function (DUF3631)
MGKRGKKKSKLPSDVEETLKGVEEAESLLEPHWKVSPANDPVDAAQLFTEIEACILRYVVMAKDLAFVVALWIGQTWVHHHGTYSPILGVTSAERDSGKSTLMGVISFLVRRSFLGVSVSAAALFRSIEKWSPTFVIDEADDAFVDSPDLRSVINSGWTRGQGIPRVDPETLEVRKYSTFCPKAIASKGKKMPDTMLSRTIFAEMKRRLKGEKIEHFRHLDDAGFQRMRSQLARWAQDCGEALGAAVPAQPDGFINRTASNWQLMFAIADSLGKEVGERARKVAQRLVGVTDTTSAGVALLRDIKGMFDSSTVGEAQGGKYLSTKVIIERLTADPEKPWVEWKHGKPITDRGVAELLHEFRIISKTVGPEHARCKGYRMVDFKDVWERYLPPPEAGKGEGASDGGNLPFSRTSPCNDYEKDEKGSVQHSCAERQKIDVSSNDSNEVNGRTAKGGIQGPPPDGGHPLGRRRGHLVLRGTGVSLLRCAYCQEPGAEPWDLNGRTINLHHGCHEVWVEEQERTTNTRVF